MTLLSTITNDEINKNLKARFTNQEIYVSTALYVLPLVLIPSRHISPMSSSRSTPSEASVPLAIRGQLDVS